MIKRYISLLFSILIIYACATVQSPTGGEKDEKAPILYESNPADQSINFKGTEIRLFFNEWMKLEQIQNELIITPREEIDYEANLKKQELIILLEKPLKDSTTYTFNFREALKDITEGNLWENPVIAFSTGPFLDSLEFKGQVENVFTHQAQKDFLVGLYDANYDSADLRQGKPVYFTTTDENGNYRFRNLKAGDYRLYTFRDSNNDLINNSQSEAFGFHSEIISLYDSIGNIELTTYKRNEDTLKLKKYSPVGKDFIIQYNKGIKDYSLINPIDSSQYIYANDVEKSKYIKVYRENFLQLDYETDSVLLISHVIDSTYNNRTDSVYVKFRESRVTNDSIKILTKPEGKITSGIQEFELSTTKPIFDINYDSIQIRYDSIPVYRIDNKNVKISANKKNISILTKLDKSQVEATIDSITAYLSTLNTDTTTNENDSVSNETDTLSKNLSENKQLYNSNNTSNSKKSNLNLYIGQAAFIGIEKDSSKSSSTKIEFKEAEEYGIIKGKVIGAEVPFVVELLDEEFNVLDSISNQEEYTFQYVEPGDYKLRLLKDENNNQKWDAGNPFTLKESEKYIFLNELITVKANWEVIDKNFDLSVENEVDNSVKEEDL